MAIRGDVLYQSQLSETLPSNTPIDTILSFERKHVYEISSQSNDRFHLGYVIALGALKFEGDVLWITSGNFDPHHLKSIASDAKLLDRIRISNGYTHTEIMETSRAIRREGEKGHKFPLIIVEMTPFSSLGESAQSHSTVVKFISYMRQVAQVYDIVVVLLNNAVRSYPTFSLSAFAGTYKPALGASLAHLVDASIWLTKRQEFTIAEVIRSRQGYTGRWVAFKMPSRVG